MIQRALVLENLHLGISKDVKGRWVWINTYENTIFSGMNIHFNPAILMWTTGVPGFWPIPRWPILEVGWNETHCSRLRAPMFLFWDVFVPKTSESVWSCFGDANVIGSCQGRLAVLARTVCWGSLMRWKKQKPCTFCRDVSFLSQQNGEGCHCANSA